MSTADWALVVSFFSLLISMSGFVWNVWSKFIFPKPRLQVSFMVMKTLPPIPKIERFLDLSVTNHGPGDAIIKVAVVHPSRFWYKRRVSIGILNPIHDLTRPEYGIGPYAGGLPKKLAVGESFSLYFPYTSNSFLREPLGSIGIHDSFNRSHWAPRKDFRRACEKYRSDFLSDIDS